MNVIHVDTETIADAIPKIRARDEVYLSGVIYTARDAAHKKLCAMLEKGETPPFPLQNAIIYYAGPTPERPGQIIGSCGPTTSSRMDAFSPLLMAHGAIGMIGKGPRSKEVVDAIVRYRGIYFCAIGGAGALAARAVKKLDVIAFPELGCESVKRLVVEELPVYCGIDCFGQTMFGTDGQKQ